MASLFSPPKIKLPKVQTPAELNAAMQADAVRQDLLVRERVPIGIINRLGVQNPGLAIDERRNEWKQ